MAENREWFEVAAGGRSIDNYEYPNEEMANAAAEDFASDSDGAVCVVYCRRTEIRQFQRAVTVTATDVGTVPALSAGSSA